MATILIRDMPEEIHSELVCQAEKNRRSKEKQALFLIENGLRRKKQPEQTLHEARKLHRRFKGEIAMSEVLKYTEAEH